MTGIFIVASERSGTNLLRRMLGAHPDVAAPPNANTWTYVSDVLPYYGPLEDDDALDAMIHDAVALTQVEGSHVEWKHRIDPEEVRDDVRDRSVSGVCAAVYDAYADREGASRWVCKENNLFEEAHRIHASLDEPRFVYLCRDGRDVACSIKKIPGHDQHIHPIAVEWRQQQEACLRVHQDLAPSGASTILRYEDLLDRPEEELRDLCAFLDLPFDPAMLRFHEEDEAKEEADRTEYWENLDRPVMRGNKGKYRDQLTEGQVEVFEAEAGSLLELLGYPRMHESPRSPSLPARALYRLQNRVQVALRRREQAQDPGRQARAAQRAEIRRRREAPGEPFKDRVEY